MIHRRSMLKSLMLACPWLVITSPAIRLNAQAVTSEVQRRTLSFRGEEREYFVRLPENFNPENIYWPLVVIHGGEGNDPAHWFATEVYNNVNELSFDAIVVWPTLTSSSGRRFASHGEDEFLLRVLDELGDEYQLRAKMLLTGYSGGGHFSHRFALQNPGQVEAVAPFAAGHWTTPDGTLLTNSLGEVSDPVAFFSDEANAQSVSEGFSYMFDPEVARAAGNPAKAGAKDIPFLVMCGMRDPRFSVTQQFAEVLREEGYMIRAEWTETPHSCSGGTDEVCMAEFQSEFDKYYLRVVEFFQELTTGA